MSKLRVFSASYNSHKFSVNCIESVARQTVVPHEHFYIDDCSKDDTVDHIKENSERLFSLIDNRDYKASIKIRGNKEGVYQKYKLLNLYEYVTECEPDDIICILDGDDWLSSEDALEKVLKAYEDPSIKYAYTNWLFSHNGEIGISKHIPSNNWNPYENPWVTSAMSTFKVSEFLKIPIANFLRWDYKWFRMGCDQAYILPILYQLWKENGNYDAVKFIDEPLYTYQFTENPNKLRNDKTEESTDMRVDAYNSVEFIKKRGYVNCLY